MLMSQSHKSEAWRRRRRWRCMNKLSRRDRCMSCIRSIDNIRPRGGPFLGGFLRFLGEVVLRLRDLVIPDRPLCPLPRLT